MFIEKMQYGQDKFYINCLKNLKNNLKNDPEKAEKDITVNGVWMFRDAVNNGDLATAHELLDLGVLQTTVEGWRVEVEAIRCRHWEATRCRPVGHITAVTNLNTYGCTLVVHSVGKVTQGGHNLVTKPKLLVERYTATID